MNCLKNSINTGKEMENKGKIKIKKNIDNICEIYDHSKNSQEERKEKLKQKMNSDFLNIIKSIKSADRIEKFEDLIRMFDALKSELLEVLEACIAKSPTRQDVINEYLEFFHEKICKELKIYWDENNEKIENINLLK